MVGFAFLGSVIHFPLSPLTGVTTARSIGKLKVEIRKGTCFSHRERLKQEAVAHVFIRQKMVLMDRASEMLASDCLLFDCGLSKDTSVSYSRYSFKYLKHIMK